MANSATYSEPKGLQEARLRRRPSASRLFDSVAEPQQRSSGLQCAEWELAALSGRTQPSSRSLKEILELQNISLHAPSTNARLQESRGQMHEVEQALARHKEHYAKEEEQFRIKEAQLKDKEAQLHLQLNRFNKFVDTNEEKRRRAEKRAAVEREAIKEKESAIATLMVEVEQAEAKEQELEAGVKRYRKFEEFLTAVMHVRDEFPEISDMMSRYDLLQSVNGTLVKKEEELNLRADKIRGAYQTYKRHAANEILEKNNSVAALQRELEMYEKEKTNSQGQTEEMLNHASEEALYFGKLLLSVENLFQRCIEKRPNIQHANHLVKRLLRRQAEALEGDAGIPGASNPNSPCPASIPPLTSPSANPASGSASIDDGASTAKSSVIVTVAPPVGPSAKITGKGGPGRRLEGGSPADTRERRPTREGADGNAAKMQSSPQPSLASDSMPVDGFPHNTTRQLKKVANGNTPLLTSRKRRENKASEKTGDADEVDEQKQLCDDAIQMLGVVANYMRDFKDICDILTKSKKLQQKGAKMVNVSLGYCRNEEVVEFVTLRDVYAMKGGGGSAGSQGASDALSSGSSRRFVSRTRGQLTAGPTGQIYRNRLNSRSTAAGN
ncbi:hypothetical protein BESB_030800 [Besnoitia besnoiti]|uniref:DUF4200 domain-containing protein n=1 Tax=Besnoitia besnoiti TaxID=94643 RepID=A0A2A9M5P2_BESBE|nr:hypothetical protein BESB_030800 [Besnoitia besnoiti]PFH31206.1 hypothetical protein BESB_030800 [Besnoitia besnoiti]